MKKTKIIATIGPSTSSRKMISKMISSGVNIVRINMSHTRADEATNIISIIREESKLLDVNTSILMDVCGPKIRVKFANSNHRLKFTKGQLLTIGSEKSDIPLNHSLTFSEVDEHSYLKIDDGKYSFKVESYTDSVLSIKSNQEGIIDNGKGINFPNIHINLPSVTDKDLDDLQLALQHEVDWVALSYIRDVRDIERVKEFFIRKNQSIPIIAKIEKPEAINCLNEIIEVVDGILVARGDLGVEMPIKELPILQKRIVNKCLFHRKPVIIATQMLENMIDNSTPTRAEVNDIANAIYDGADAIMLSGETAIGKYPIESVNIMNSVAKSIESDLNESNFSRYMHEHTVEMNDNRSSICHAAMTISEQMDIKGIVIMTESGTTAIKMAQYRPNAVIFAMSPHIEICNKLSLIWGIIPIHVDRYENTDDMISEATIILKKKNYVRPGDIFLITAGVPVGISGTTDMVKIHIAN